MKKKSQITIFILRRNATLGDNFGEKEWYKMERTALILAVILLLGGVFVASSPAREMTAKGWSAHEVSQLLNYSVVNRNGKFLGRIQDNDLLDSSVPYLMLSF